jgi:thioesterase domain-containing protein/aryl carrier-like protein
VIPLNKQLLLKSSLGKISRTKIRVAFESGEYRSYQQANDQAIEAYRTRGEDPLNKAEEIIMNTCCDLLGAPNSKFEVNTSLLQLGITSIQIIQLKQELQRKFDLKIEIPVLTILTNPSIRDLAAALNYLDSAPKYNPAVILQSQGAETPLWLIHSEVGEVLAFLDLAKYITDRPVYALRAQGTEGDEDFFRDIPDAVNVYHAAIKNLQPEGPYAIAGFSYGAILAVEVAKALEAGGDVIPFLGVFNPPPCVGTQIRQLEWTETILELSYFLGLITESYAREISPKLQYLSQEEVSEFIIEHSERKRVGELAFDKKKLARWADLAHAFYTMAREYEPTGTVDSIDVFYAAPPPAVSEDKEGWISDHLYKWGECARSEPRFHAADGTLHTMVGPDHVFSFQQKLKAVLHERGL